MKKVLNRFSLALMTLLFLLGAVLLGVSITSAKATENAYAAQADTKVTITSNKTKVVPGETFQLTVTVSTSVANRTWSSLDFMVSPLGSDGLADANLCQYLTMDNHTTNMTSYQDNTSDYFKVDPNLDVPGIRVSLAWRTGDEISASNDCVFTFNITVSDGLSGGASLLFGLEEWDANTIGYNWGDVYVSADQTNLFTCETVTVTVGAPSSEAAISSLKAGSGTATGGVDVAEQMTFENPAASLTNFHVLPQLSDPNATYQVCVAPSSATEGTFPADKTTGAIKHGAQSGDLDLTLGGTNTTGIAKVFIRVIAPDKVTTKDYSLTVKSGYARIKSLTVTTQRPGGAVEVPKNGLEGTFSDSKKSYTVYVPSDVPASAGVQLVPTSPSGYGMQENIAVTSKNCTAANVVTSGNTLNVTGIQDGATLALTLTAASGKTETYDFVFKTVNIDTSIESFTMKGKDDKATYNSDSSKASADYYFSLPSSTGFQGTFQITLKAPATSTVTVGGQAYDNTKLYGPGTYTVTVTAQAGNTKNYSVTVENKFDAAKFESVSIAIGGASYQEIFASGGEGSEDSWKGWEGLMTPNAIYTCETPVTGNTEFKIKGTATAGATVTAGKNLTESHSGQNYVFTGTIAHGKNEFRIALSTDEGIKNYTFVVNMLEKKNTITGMTLVRNGTAIGGFNYDANKKDYSVTVPYSVSAAQLTVKTDGVYTRVFAENGDMFSSDSAKLEHKWNLTFALPSPDETVNTIKFRAVSDMNIADLSQAGDWYTITVTRAAANKDVSLKELSIKIGTKTYPIQLKDGQYTYPLELTDETLDSASVSITATANASTSTVSGDNIADLKFESSKGINSFNVTVTSEDGVTKKTYTIAVSRNEISLNSDITIKSITILGNDAVDYSVQELETAKPMEITVPFGVTRVTITAVPGYSGAHVEGIGTVELASEAGVAKEIKVYAVAEDLTNQDGSVAYVFKITREEQRKSGLSNITVGGVQLVGFNKDTTVYSYQVVSTTTAVELRAIAENPDATVEIGASNEATLLGKSTGEATGSVVFKEAAGESARVIVTIRVEIDNQPMTYTVTITRASQSPQLVSLRIGDYNIYDKDGNIVDKEDEQALNNAKTFYVYIDSAKGLKLDITAKASDDLATIKFSDDPEKYIGIFTCEGFDLTDKLKDSATANIPLLVMAADGEGNYTSYQIIFTLLSSDTSASITIFQDGQEKNPLDDFNNAYIANPSAPVYGPYPVEKATLDFKIKFENESAKGTYEVRRRNHGTEDILMVSNGEAVDGGIRLAYGTNIFCLKITSSDKKAERTVVVILERGGVGAKSISIDGSEDFKFNANSTSFICSVGNSVTSLKNKIAVTLNNDDLEYQLVGDDKELKEGGFTQIEIKIFEKTAGAAATADTEPLKTLYINVFRPAAVVPVVEKSETPLWQIILFWVLVGLVVVELIVIIVIPKRKKGTQQVVVAAPMAYVPPVQATYTAPVQPQAPQTPATPAQPQTPAAPSAPARPAPKPAEPSRSQNAKPFVSPDNSGYYGSGNGGYYNNSGNGGYYNNGGYGGYGSNGNGSYGSGGYGGYGNNNNNNDDKY